MDSDIQAQLKEVAKNQGTELFAYQIEFNRKDQQKIEDFEKKLHEHLDDRVILYIKNAFPLEDPEDDEPPFEMELTRQTKVEDIEKQVRKKMELKPEQQIRLVYQANQLEKGKCLNDYYLDAEMKRWPRPYAGIIFVSENHVEPGQFNGVENMAFE